MKNKIRFLKKITVISIIMSMIITFSTLVLCFIQQEITAGILSALLGAWSIELCLTAIIKNNEWKEEKKISIDVNDSEPDPTKDSI